MTLFRPAYWKLKVKAANWTLVRYWVTRVRSCLSDRKNASSKEDLDRDGTWLQHPHSSLREYSLAFAMLIWSTTWAHARLPVLMKRWVQTFWMFSHIPARKPRSPSRSSHWTDSPHDLRASSASIWVACQPAYPQKTSRSLGWPVTSWCFLSSGMAAGIKTTT